MTGRKSYEYWKSRLSEKAEADVQGTCCNYSQDHKLTLACHFNWEVKAAK